jgi:hypothetical protein
VETIEERIARGPPVVRRGVAGAAKRQIGADRAGGIEPEIDVLAIGERLQQQHGAGREHHGARDLHGDERRAPSPARPRIGRATRACGLQRRLRRGA